MRHRTRAKAPSDLPHARLYLDDIEAIAQILTQAIVEATNESKKDDAPAPEVKASYKIADVEDEMDSVNDLLEHGGSVREFDAKWIAPVPYRSAGLKIRGESAPSLYLYGLGDGREWEVYGKIRAIFTKRRMALKNLISDLPESVKFAALIVLVSAFTMPNVMRGRTGAMWNAIAISYLAVWLIVIMGMVISFLPSRVYLVRSHQRSKASREARRSYALHAFTFALGAIFVKLLDYIFARFFK